MSMMFGRAYMERAGKGKLRTVWPCGHSITHASSDIKLLNQSRKELGGNATLGRCPRCYPPKPFAIGSEVRVRDSVRIGMVLTRWPVVKEAWVYRVRWANEDVSNMAHMEMVAIGKRFKADVLIAIKHPRAEAPTQLLTLIQQNRKGITTKGLASVTGYKRVRIRGLVARLVRDGMVRALKDNNAGGWRFYPASVRGKRRPSGN